MLRKMRKGINLNSGRNNPNSGVLDGIRDV